MSFASIHFIFVFLPISLVLFYLAPKGNWRNGVLVFASLVFFAWADFAHLPLLVLFVLVNYGFGILIDRLAVNEKPRHRRAVMWTAIGANLLILVLFKYLGFFNQVVSDLSQGRITLPQLSLMLGISYLTFSGISYILDVYKKVRKPEKNLLRFSAYLVMFPKLIQGPIALFRDIQSQLETTGFDLAGINLGVRRFILGLAKKILLADSLAIAAERVFSTDYKFIGADAAWFGLIAYTLVIYFDFAGYTDMALGIGRMFGFDLPENFNFPYISRSISEFWRRWHMTLTHWFRTYVFIPMEYSRRRSKFFRQQTNILIVFFLTGLWHGASWNFILWGSYFGLILVAETSGLGRLLKKTPNVVQHIYAMGLVTFGWVLFRITDLQDWGPFFKALMGGNGLQGVETLRSLNVLVYLPIVMVGVLLSTPVFSKLRARIHSGAPVKRLMADAVLLGLFFLALAYILSNGFQPFMYAQF